MENNETSVDYSNNSEGKDLSGQDLISLFGKTRVEVQSSIGLKIAKDSIEPISVPTDKVTSMAGEVADEVHEWPNATQGKSFRSLSLHFKDGVLIALEWNFSLQNFLPKKPPWYRKWM